MPSEALLTDTLNLGVDDIPAEYRTSFLLATLFRVKLGGIWTNEDDRITLRAFPEAVLGDVCTDAIVELDASIQPVFPLSFYNPTHTCLQMQNAFNLKSNSLDERVKVLSTCRDDELVFKCYTKQYGLGCKHYLRKCQVYCVACDRFYFCRQCHNEAHRNHDLEYIDSSHTTPQIKCVLCGTVSPPTSICPSCGVNFAEYYCPMCLLYCDAGQEMHPRGHCSTCGVCVLYNNTLPGVEDRCQLHVSNDAVDEDLCQFCMGSVDNQRSLFLMPCGAHYAHTQCYTRSIAECSYQCPSCKKLILYSTMRAEFEVRMRELFEITKRPPEILTNLASYICHECGESFVDQPHIVPLRCWNPACLSFNTAPIDDKMTSNMRRQIFEAQNQVFRRMKLVPLEFNLERALIRMVYNLTERYGAEIRAHFNLDANVPLGERYVVSYLSELHPDLFRGIASRDDLLERLQTFLNRG
ncbi:Zinc finger protein [Giardia duodenalis]|uniref:Zinc finger protein n=1 Tax=Giardia intestinalis TaxID=5741 RepID=V6TDR2_GIAIN|nr:Zinc finger protein [Giardia intestinalis]